MRDFKKVKDKEVSLSRRPCRQKELRANALMALAFNSLGAVHAARESRWPKLVGPKGLCDRTIRQHDLELER